MTPRRWLGLIACVILLAHALRWLDQTCDDVFISLRYAKNLADGHGLTFNPGLRDEGYSNLLWVLLVAAGAWLGIAPLLVAKLLSLAAGLAIGALLVTSSRDDEAIVPVAALALCASPHFAFWTAQALETVAFGLLALLLVLFASAEAPTRRTRVGAIVVAVLAAWIRPEGALLGVLTCMHQLLRRRRGALLLGFSTLAAVGIQLLFRHAYYGRWVANPFYLKIAEQRIETWRIGVQYAKQTLHETGGVIFVPLAALALVIRRSPRITLAATLAIGHLVLFTIPVLGDYMRGARFLVPMLPLWYLLAEEGLLASCAWLSNRSIAIVSGLIVAVGIRLVGVDPIPRFPTFLATRRIAPANAHHRVAEWLSKNVPAQSTVLASEMGIIPYYSPQRFIDYLGLVDRRSYGTDLYLPDLAKLAELYPDVLVLTTIDGSGGRLMHDRIILESRSFMERYVEAYRVTIHGRDDEESSRYYEFIFSRRTLREDSISFVIFRRRREPAPSRESPQRDDGGHDHARELQQGAERAGTEK